MSINSAFKSTHPTVVEHHRQWKEASQRQHDALREIEETYGRSIYVTNSVFGRRITGLAAAGSEDKRTTPEGFRYDRSKGFLVPALRTAKGKKIRDEWKALELSKPKTPGLPEVVMSSSGDFQTYMHSPSCWDWDGVVYCGWGCAADYVTGRLDDNGRSSTDFSKTGFDPEMWTEIRLSEFFAAHEAMRDSIEAAGVRG